MSDPNRFVASRRKRYYWRPDFGGSWMGPPDDRIWVPGMDWPDGAPPPRDEPDDSNAMDTGPAPVNDYFPRLLKIWYPRWYRSCPPAAPQNIGPPIAPALSHPPLPPGPFQHQFGSLPVQGALASQNMFPPGYLGGSFFPGPINQPGPTTGSPPPTVGR
ncbi:hypothetical protein R3P38DRAFT_2810703, partial [Favolaschia claudopus]